jgi:hypothetical protein
VLNVLVAKKVSLERPCVVPTVGERVATGVAEHVRVCLKSKVGLDPVILAKPAVENGEPL